jgi:transcription elongation factor Elf1
VHSAIGLGQTFNCKQCGDSTHSAVSIRDARMAGFDDCD